MKNKARRFRQLREGHKYRVLFKKPPFTEIQFCFIPIQVEKERPMEYRCLVLPHLNPYNAFGMSRPYTLTIPKWDLSHGKDYVAIEYDENNPVVVVTRGDCNGF